MSRCLENLRLADSITGKVFLFPKNSPCAACGSQQDETNKKTKLVIDHDRWLPRPDRLKPTIIRYRTRLLCLECNLRKGNRRYVPFKDGTWFPGMKPGIRIYFSNAKRDRRRYRLAWKWVEDTLRDGKAS